MKANAIVKSSRNVSYNDSAQKTEVTEVAVGLCGYSVGNTQARSFGGRQL